MITIKSISIVIPSEPTPGGLLHLSESDQVVQFSHASVIHIYRPNTNTNTNTIPFSFETMKSSLSRALVHFYPLAGRLHWIEGGRLELDCNAMGVQLWEAYSDAKLDELGDFAPIGVVQDLVPKIDYTTPIEEWPLFLVQLTRFSCGGLCVGTALCHTMVDGISATHFISSWAKLARGDNLEDHEMPFLDRTVLRSSEPLMPLRFDHIAYTTKPPLLIGSKDAKEEQKKETSVTLLKLTKDQVEQLKKRANYDTQLQDPTIRPYSRYEAVAGHMWRCVCKARSIDNNHDDQPTRVRLVVDVRNRLNPPLPQRYFGNAVFLTITSTCLYGDLLSKPLSYSAGKLREANERMTEEYIKSALDFLTSQKDVSGLRSKFDVRGDTEGPFQGNPNLSLGSWINVPIYDIDFGWGKPVYVGPGLLDTEGRSFIMPSGVADGSLNIAFCLQTQYMDSFKKYFYEDFN
uniref:Spermidine hydroxycinnamoyl transferase n=1 Tax=Fagus sylvatica TaxID=28930 RepID=A0A2N9FU64_FAGSY